MALHPRDRDDFMSQQQGHGQQQEKAMPATASYKFTPEELRVLKECNKEAFYYRCLPLGTAMGVGAYLAVRKGFLKPSAKWGAGPKMLGFSFIGYFVGKFSYQATCVEKLMRIPNSPLADMLRKKKGVLGFQESITLEPGFVTAAPAVVGGPAFGSDYAQAEQSCFTDVGDTRPMSSIDIEPSSSFSGDYGKYDTTHQMLNDDNLPQRRAQASTTYDELRRQNRNEYDSKPHGSSSAPIVSNPSEFERTRRQNLAQRESEPAYSASARKNEYGDVWDDKVQ